MALLRRALSLGLCAALLAPSLSAFAAPDDPMTRTARDLYEAGTVAYQQGHWEECYAKLVASWAAFHHSQIAGLLGICEAKLGRVEDAAEHLDYAVSHDDQRSPASTETNRIGFDEVKKRVAAFQVRSNVDNAELRIDGKPTMKVPPVTVYLVPGPHVFEARHDGFAPATKTFDAHAGDALLVELNLVTNTAADVATPAPERPPHESASPPETPRVRAPTVVPGLVGGGVGLIGLGVGIGLLAASGSRGSSADALAASLSAAGAGCKPPVAARFAATCDDLASQRSSHDALHNSGAILVGASAAVLAGSIVYLIWRSSRAGDSAVQAVPTFGVGSAGFSVIGSF